MLIRKNAIINRFGYIIDKDLFSDNELKEVKMELTLTPFIVVVLSGFNGIIINLLNLSY